MIQTNLFHFDNSDNNVNHQDIIHMSSNTTLNPWKDIMSYESNDQKFFKGRDEDIKKFLNILDNGSFSVIYSASGIGKTSFLNAGIEPRMMEQGFLPIHILLHWKEDIEVELIKTINETLKNFGIQWKPTFTEWNVLKNKDRKKYQTICEQSLWWRLRTYELVGQNKKDTIKYHPLLIFDQFEEIFRNEGICQPEHKKRLFQLLETIYSYTIPENIHEAMNLIFEQGYFLEIPQRHQFKAIFSLRKEYLSDLDYWTNDKHRIQDLLNNRMLLLPMTREQAEKVITQQPLLDEYGHVIEDEHHKNNTLVPVKDEIIEFVDEHKRNEVEPFLLSVLCSRLFEFAAKSETKELSKDILKGWNIQTIIRDFYEELIQRCLNEKIFETENDIILFENILVSDKDGHRIRASIRDNYELHRFIKRISTESDEKKEENENVYAFLKRLEDIHLVRITSLGDERFVELVHDRFAEVIYKRQKERERKLEEKKGTIKVILLRSVMFLVTLLTLWCTIYFGVNVRKNGSSANDLTRINTLKLTTEDSIWLNREEKPNGGCLLQDNSLVESFTITGGNNKVAIIDCYMLKTIVIERFNKDNLSLSVENCPQLAEIIFKDHVKKLDCHINGCPKVQIHLDNTIEIFKLDTKEKYLTFKVHENNSNYLWKDHILWNIRKNEEAIIYAQDGVPTSIPFPPSYKKHSLPVAKLQKDIENSRMTSSKGGDSILLLNHPNITENLITNRDVQVVFLGDSVTTICRQAFKGCKQLRRVHFPKHEIKIYSEAFAGCSSLDSVIFKGDTVYMAERVFAGCKSLETIHLPLHVNVETITLNFSSTTFGIKHEEKYTMLPYAYNPFMECSPNLSPQIKNGGDLVEENGIIFLKDFHIPIFVRNNTAPYNHGYFFTEQGSLFAARKHTKSLCWLSRKKEERSETILNKYGNINDTHGALFLGDVILPTSGATELKIPAKVRCKYYFPTGAGQLQEIHIPYPQPEGMREVGTTKIPTKLDFDLPDSIKEQITLFVPYGSKRFYENCARFNAFKAIREEGDRTDVYQCFAGKLNDAMLLDLNNHKYLYVLYILIVIIIGWCIYRLRWKQLSHTKKTIAAKREACWFALTYVIVAVVLYYVLVQCFMVFTTISVSSPIYAGNFHHIPIALLTLGGATLFMYAPELTRYISKSWSAYIKSLKNKAAPLRQWFRKIMVYKKIICYALLIAFAIVFVCILFLRAINPEKAMKRGDYDRALELFSNHYLSFKSLSENEQQLLRSLLIREHCIPGVPDSTIWEDVSGWMQGSNYYGVSTPDGYLCYDLKNKVSFNIPKKQADISISPTGKFAICRDDSTYIYGKDCQWTIPRGDKSTTHWYEQDRYLFIQYDSICNIYDTNNGKCVFSSDFNFHKDTPGVKWVSTPPLYIEPYSTIVIKGYKTNIADRYGPIHLLNLKSMKQMKIDFWPIGILKNRFLIKSEGQNTQLFDLSKLEMLAHKVSGYADYGDYDNLLCNFPCAIYFLSDDGSNISCLDLDNEFWYARRINNQYVLLQKRQDSGIVLLDLIHSKQYDLPVKSENKISYKNMSVHNNGRELYLYDNSTKQAYVYHLYEDRIELRYNTKSSSGNISYGYDVLYIGNMCYYYYEDYSCLVKKDDERSFILCGDGYIVEKCKDQPYHIYPIGSSKEEAIPIGDYYPTIICGWEIRHSNNQTQLINIMSLRQLIEKSSILTDEQKQVLFKRL